MSVLICISNILESIYIFATLPDEDTYYSMQERLPSELKQVSIINDLHGVMYVTLVLITISAYIQIMTGLKVTYTENCYNIVQMQHEMARTIRSRNTLFFLCALILLSDILLLIFSMVDSVPIEPEATLVYYLVLLPVLAILYITIVCIIFSYMNSACNP